MGAKRAGWMLVAVSITGCMLMTPESRMSDAGAAPNSWASTREAEAGIDAQWVKRFGGKDLERLVEEAYKANRDLQAAAARVDKASAVAKGAAAAARPQVNAAVSGSRDARNFIGFPIGGGGVLKSIDNTYGAQLGLSWEIDLWGRLRAGQNAAIADMQAQGNLYRSARASLAAQVVRAWLLVSDLNGRIQLAKEALKTRQDTAELIRGRFLRATGGSEATAAQLRLAESDVETARASLQERKGERDQAVRQLEILLGRYPAAQIIGSSKLPRVKSMPPAGLPSELLLRRPDILAAERRLVATGGRKREAFLAFFPSFSLTGSRGQSSDQLSNISNSDFGVWSIAGQITQPILQGGRLKSVYVATKAEEKEALANLQQTVLNGFGEVETALAADRYLARRVDAIDSASRLARDSAEAARLEFTRGTGSVLTLLASENRRIELESQQMMLRRLRLENRVNLHLALGGDYKIQPKD